MIFDKIPIFRRPRNNFDLSHWVKMSFKQACLIPTTVMDVLPGDKFTISPHNLLRFAPLASPVMHEYKVTTDYYFVPNRLLWPNWEDWITGKINTLPPYFQNGDEALPKSLADYLGFPQAGNALAGGLEYSAFPLAAYLLIYDEWYRDQNLQSEEFIPLVAGAQGETLQDKFYGPPLKRAWNRDYLTSALPFPQSGDAVTLPLIDGAPVDVTLKTTGTGQPLVKDTTNLTPEGSADLGSDGGGALTNTNTNNPVVIDPNGSMEVDLNPNAATINSLRRAFSLQRFLERTARGGNRYTELIRSNFGVRPEDSRLQRPELIGRMRQSMTISEVLSTAQTETTGDFTPVGDLKGHGISAGGGKTFNYFAKEHGWIIGIINVQPETAYQQALPKKFRRLDRFDYFWPDLANIGEQAILNHEVSVHAGDTGTLRGTFAYTPRYSEYRTENNRVAGEFKTNLNFWHAGRIFNTPGVVPFDSAFIQADPTRRIFTITDPEVDTIYANIRVGCRGTRVIPKFGVPKL